MNERALIEVKSNFQLVARERGKIVARRESHNVFLNQGRTWVRNTLAAASFPAATTADRNLTSDGGQSSNEDTHAIGGKTFRVRYIGVGIGGSKQNQTPPGAQTQEELATITAMEYPIKVDDTAWLKQVLTSDNQGDTTYFPDAYTYRFRAVFGYDDLSFSIASGQVDFGQGAGVTNVPVSEFGLFTSEAGRDVQPAKPVSKGLIAYNTELPLIVTPNFMLELDWTLSI